MKEIEPIGAWYIPGPPFRSANDISELHMEW